MILTNVQAVEIRFVKPADMRYDTVGDWQWQDQTLVITVAKPAALPAVSPMFVAIHELVEAILCDLHGVTAEQVDAFDLSPARRGSEYEDEPGLDPKAPYHIEHMAADLIERMVCQLLGLPWDVHERNVEYTAAAVHDARGEKP